MFCMLKRKNISSNREKQIMLLMIPNGEGWYYFAVKKLSALLTRIMSKHHGEFCCLNCLHSFVTEDKLNFMKKHMKIKIFVKL